MQSDNEKTADVVEDYTWKVVRSGNPNKAWIVYQNKKISALMTTRTARDIATIHNMTLKFLGNKAAMPKVSEEELAKALCDEAWKRDCRSGATKEDWATYNWKYYARSARSILARLPQIRKE